MKRIIFLLILILLISGCYKEDTTSEQIRQSVEATLKQVEEQQKESEKFINLVNRFLNNETTECDKLMIRLKTTRINCSGIYKVEDLPKNDCEDCRYYSR